MAKHGYFNVRTTQEQGRYRAGIRFTREWRLVNFDELTEEQRRQIEEDPVITFKPAELPSAATEAKPASKVHTGKSKT